MSDASEHPFASLTPDFIMDAIESLGYRCDARILELNSYENRVYQIGIEDAEPIIAKFYRPGRWTAKQIREEHEFTLELDEAEITVAPPLALGGETLHEVDGFAIGLFARRGGRAPPIDDLDCLTVIGRFVARIHNVGATMPFQHRPTISVADYGWDARSYLLENNFLPGELVSAYETTSQGLLDLVEAAFTGAPPRLLRLHADCHMGNVLWRDDTPHFVDFDDTRMGPAIQDLWMLLSGDQEARSLQMQRILEGYHDFRDFDLAELRLIEPLRTLRMMHHAAWLARRWDDPAFPRAFPFFNTAKYWSEHVLELREQWARVEGESLQLMV